MSGRVTIRISRRDTEVDHVRARRSSVRVDDSLTQSTGACVWGRIHAPVITRVGDGKRGSAESLDERDRTDAQN